MLPVETETYMGHEFLKWPQMPEDPQIGQELPLIGRRHMAEWFLREMHRVAQYGQYDMVAVVAHEIYNSIVQPPKYVLTPSGYMVRLSPFSEQAQVMRAWVENMNMLIQYLPPPTEEDLKLADTFLDAAAAALSRGKFQSLARLCDQIHYAAATFDEKMAACKQFIEELALSG